MTLTRNLAPGSFRTEVTTAALDRADGRTWVRRNTAIGRAGWTGV
jgi:hypothetical protein